MKAIISSILPLFIALLSCSSEQITEKSEDKPSNTQTQTITQEIFKLTNEHRKSIGKAPLQMNGYATQLAKEHTEYMISKKRISHDLFKSRFNKLNEKVGAMSASENVAMGQKTAKQVMNSWLNSPGHRKNIESDAKFIGIAAIKDGQGRYYFTQIFYK